MKTTLAICLTVAVLTVSGVFAFAADDVIFDPILRTIQARLEQQIERIKAAGERADAQISLAKVRSSAQLERSGEDLQRQIELLERSRQDLQDYMQESQGAIDRFKNNFPALYATSLAEVDLQLGQAKSLVAQIQSAASKLASEQSGSGFDTPTTPTTPGPQSWNAPCGSGALAPPISDPPVDVPLAAPPINLDSIPDRFNPSLTPTPMPPMPPVSGG